MDRNLWIAKERAKYQGIKNFETLNISNRKNKRFMILSPQGKKIHFGLYPFQQGTFIDHFDKTKRKNWRARHSRILLNNEPAYLNKESPEFYSWNLLW
jgi:hypothetical protein